MADALVAGYEALRAQVLGLPPGGRGPWGWAVLARRGLATWLCSAPAAPPTLAPTPNRAPAPLPVSGLREQLANLLVTMVWEHYPHPA